MSQYPDLHSPLSTQGAPSAASGAAQRAPASMQNSSGAQTAAQHTLCPTAAAMHVSPDTQPRAPPQASPWAPGNGWHLEPSALQRSPSAQSAAQQTRAPEGVASQRLLEHSPPAAQVAPLPISGIGGAMATGLAVPPPTAAGSAASEPPAPKLDPPVPALGSSSTRASIPHARKSQEPRANARPLRVAGGRSTSESRMSWALLLV